MIRPIWDKLNRFDEDRLNHFEYETAADSAALTLSLSDTIALTDALTGLGYGLLTTDTVVLGDYFTYGKRPRWLDAYAQSVGPEATPLTLSLSDSIDNLTDSLRVGHGHLYTETITLTDSTQLGHGHLYTDSYTLTDAESNRLGQLKTFSDDVNLLADSVTLVLGQLKTFSDDINLLADAYAQRAAGFQSFSDTITLTDSLLIGHGHLYTDTLNALTDAAALRLGQLLGFSDALTLTDAYVQHLAVGLVLTDSLTLLTDGDQRLDYGIAISDGIIVLSDAYEQNLIANLVVLDLTLSDSFTLTDSINLGYGLRTSDAITITDAYAALLHYSLFLDDDINTFVDLFVSSAPQAPGLQVGVTDSLAPLTDSVTLRLGHNLILADNTANWADSLAKTVGIALILTDNGPVFTDALTLFSPGFLHLSDTLTITDAFATFGENYLTIADSFLLTDDADVELRGPDFNIIASDQLTLTDEISLSLNVELQLQLSLVDTILLTDHYFDLRRPYATSVRRYVVVSSAPRIRTVTSVRVTTVPARNRTTEP